MKAKDILKERHGYIAFELDEQSRNILLKTFPPKYPEVIGHHITHQFGVPEGTKLPSDVKDVKVIGYADDGTSLEALVVDVNGSTQRPDGGTYHITWSLDREQGRKPVHSNNLIKEQGYERISPIQITVIPEFF